MDAAPVDASDAAVERLVDYWTPLAVRALAAAGVFAAFGAETRAADEVARETGVDPGALRRFLRALASVGVTEPAGDGRYRLTALGLRLVPGSERSRAGMATLKPYELHAWAEVGHALRTGEAAFPHHFGVGMFDWIAQDPERVAHFDATMRVRTATLLEAALPLARWPEQGTVVDVGGGAGHLLELVLAGRPGLRGLLFDLPHVVASAPAALAAAGIADRVDVVPGSFLDTVPAGGDLYVLSQVLHDWPDDDAVRILERVRAAIPPHGRLRLFEAVLVEGRRGGIDTQLDLHMLVLFAAAERTEPEWGALLARGGFRLTAVVPTPGCAWLEAEPA
jgi:hypothetical protein